MVVQIVQFELAGIDPATYAGKAEQLAPAFAELPGLIAKAWLGDPATGTYGGVYFWADRDSAETYEGGELFAAARRNPAFANLRSSILDTLDAPTALSSPSLASLSALQAPA